MTAQPLPFIPAAPALLLERFIIMAPFHDEDGAFKPYICAETPPESFAECVALIAAGNFTSLCSVSCIRSDGIWSDVTEEVARAVMTKWAHDGEPLSDWAYEFVEQHVSMQAAASFGRRAA